MAVLSDGHDRGGQGAGRLPHVAQYAGAAVSLALILGVGVWGYRLMVRDVAGIPVVRATEGPMRVAPETPGGEIAAHTGLAVNAIAAVGEAAPPEAMLTLAPATPGLAAEDTERGPLAEAAETGLADAVSAAVPAPEVEALPAADVPAPAVPEAVPAVPPVAPAPMTADEVLALADQIAAGIDPLTDLAAGTTAPPSLSVVGEAVTDEARFTVIPADVPGVAVALRPVPRPGGGLAVAAGPVATATDAAALPAPDELTVELTAEIAAGTPLVQLGAFETPDLAAAEWDRLATRFADFMTGKTLVVQEASSGGRTFYRLRAMGFADSADARRFCSALVAEDAACIPLVAR